MNQRIAEVLDKHKIVYLKDFSESIKNYFDVQQLDADMMPKITTPVTTIIITDVEDFNSTYLIEFVDKYLSEKESNQICFIYIDDFLTRLALQAPNKVNSIPLDDNERKEFEKTILRPSIMKIDVENQEIYYYIENILSPFTYKNFVDIVENGEPKN